MSARTIASALLSFVLLAAGCDRSSDRLAAPSGHSSVAPTPPPTAMPNGANWTASATVLAVKPGGVSACGWGTSVGETRAGVAWRVTITGDAISLDEDMNNWPTDDIPYSGRLDGVQFTATYASGSNYAQFVCQFREATLSGYFNGDLSTFDGVETLVWGQPGAETTVTRHWVGSRF